MIIQGLMAVYIFMLLSKWLSYGDNTINRNITVRELTDMDPAIFGKMNANLMIMLENS